MKTAKEIALIGVFAALLIGGQLVLYGISGVEIVTALMLSFSYRFGVRTGLPVAVAFSVLRCFVFGFFPDVLILYLVYYSLFAVVFGLLGKKFNRELDKEKLAVTALAACSMTAVFTGLDDIITPLYYGLSADATKAYATASLTAVIPQLACTLVTVLLLFPVLHKIFEKSVKFR